jgi:2-polyprenyl-3-methyl-5-hydroxy-6-metoxy-1,4-benzoquinol methylase
MSDPTSSPNPATPYSDKPAVYFGHARREIEPLLPPFAARVLEVGCGSGATLRWLKQSGRCSHTTGIEVFAQAAELARGQVGSLHVGDAERLVQQAFAPASFDLVLCLDVLEHLVDPWAFVAHLQPLLAPGGVVLASIPNVRHARVVLPLLLQGRWQYADAGQLDRTHLRFFTRETALQLMQPTGLRLQQWQRRMPPPRSRSGVFNTLTGGVFKDFLAMSYLIASSKVAES